MQIHCELIDCIVNKGLTNDHAKFFISMIVSTWYANLQIYTFPRIPLVIGFKKQVAISGGRCKFGQLVTR